MPLGGRRVLVSSLVVLLAGQHPWWTSSLHNVAAAGNTPTFRPFQQGWLNVNVTDSVTPGDILPNMRVNAGNMWVIASRFNYTKALQAIKVKITGNIGKPSPTLQEPLVVSVRDRVGGHTFAVPYAVLARDGSVLAEMVTGTRFLCPGQVGETEHAVVTVGTGYLNARSPSESYTFNVKFELVGHWILDLDAPLQLEAQPTEPAVFAFTWPEKTGVDSVLVSVASVNAPHVCATVAVQQRTCPLALTPAELTTDASYITATATGALAVRRAQFRRGFYVVVLPRINDRLCDRGAPVAADPGRKKTVMVTVSAQHASRAYYAVPSVLALVLLVAGAAGTCLVRRDLRTPRLAIDPQPERDDSLAAYSEDPLLSLEMDVPTPPAGSGLNAVNLLLAAAFLLLALDGTAVVPTLREERDTGDLDLCFRNELCSHAIGNVEGANHLLARLPYVAAGVGVLLTVHAQASVYRTVTVDGSTSVGVDHDFSLLYSGGLALLLQGVLSGLYSTCASPRAAHLDVALLLYALATLCCKLFQTRRGVSATGHYTPLLLTASVVLVSFVKQQVEDAWYVWLVVGLVQVVGVVFVGLQLYVLGVVSASPLVLKRVRDHYHLLSSSPNFLMNRAAAIIVLCANVILAVACVAVTPTDFSCYLVPLFTLHTALYFVYYLLQKQAGSSETAGRPSLALLATGLLLLLAAVVVLCGFSTFSTDRSAAASRLLNRSCLGPSTLDVHDVWHLLAATALFCLSMGVTLLDDDLLFTPRVDIRRF